MKPKEGKYLHFFPLLKTRIFFPYKFTSKSKGFEFLSQREEMTSFFGVAEISDSGVEGKRNIEKGLKRRIAGVVDRKQTRTI